MPEVLKCKFCSELLQSSDIKEFQDHLKVYHNFEEQLIAEMSNYYKVMIITEKVNSENAPAFIRAGSFFGRTGINIGKAGWNWIAKKRTIEEDKSI